MLDALQASQRYTRERHSLVRPTLARVLALWGTTPPPGDWDEWFAERGPRMAAVVEAVQPRLIDLSTQAVPQILADTGSSSRAEAAVDASQLIGVAGDGRSITGLLGTAITTARTASDSAALSGAVMELGAAAQGWRAGRLDLMTKLLTVTSDTSRAAMSLETVTRPRVGYTRKLVGSSCARCVVLAGRTYRAADAFDRHPHCDCEHVPAETRFLDLATVDARVHFDGLSRAQQDRLFTKAGAQAIRDGADINQVVNARRGAGLSFASGRITKAEAEAIRNSRGGRARARSVTTEGTTRRGIAGSRLGRGPGGKRPAQQRLMPDAIYQAADGDRDLALELLDRHGYLVGGPTPGNMPRHRPPMAAERANSRGPRTDPGSIITGPPGGGGGSGVASAADGPPPKRTNGMHGPATPDAFNAIDGRQPLFRRSEVEEFELIDAEAVLDGDSTGHGFHRSGLGVKDDEFPAGWGEQDVVDLVNAIIDAPSDGFPRGRRRYSFLGAYRDVTAVLRIRNDGYGWRIATVHPYDRIRWEREKSAVVDN